jgi:hypothetical protein
MAMELDSSPRPAANSWPERAWNEKVTGSAAPPCWAHLRLVDDLILFIQRFRDLIIDADLYPYLLYGVLLELIKW